MNCQNTDKIHTDKKKMYSLNAVSICKSLWIKSSAKCINVNVNVKYRQHVTCPTRDSNILDHCYTAIKDAYHSVPRVALGLSDHCLVHLIPTYRQKLKSAKPVLRTVKRCTNETERVLQACLNLTDWSVF